MAKGVEGGGEIETSKKIIDAVNDLRRRFINRNIIYTLGT